MSDMDDLKEAVARNRDAEQSVVTLLQGISQQLKDARAANDMSAVRDVINQLDENTRALAGAVTDNTPHDDAPTAAPQPAPAADAPAAQPEQPPVSPPESTSNQ
jgi:hypothetical protein